MSLSPGKVRRLWSRGAQVAGNQKGSVIALVILFMPVALACAGIAVDLGILFTARKCVQAACDLGALAGVQELDWEALAEGRVVIRKEDARNKALEIAWLNMANAQELAEDVILSASVHNSASRNEPCVVVEASFGVRVHFIRIFIPGQGRRFSVSAEASVVERTKW